MSAESSFQTLWPKVRHVVIVVALFGLLGMSVLGLSLAAIKSDDPGSQGGGEAGRQIFYSIAFLAALAASKPLAKPQRLFALPMTLAIALLWCGLSVTWSAVPGIALRRFMLTTMIIIALFRMVEHLSFPAVIRVVRTLFVVVLMLNFAAVATLPFAIHRAAEIGDPNLAGAWRGLLPQKNFAGAVCALTIIVFALEPQRIRPAIRIAVICAAAFFLYKTKSKTSIGLLALTLAAGFAYRRYNPTYRALLIPIAMVVSPLVTLYAAKQFAGFIVPTDDQTKLTGRVDIWPPLASFIGDHPIHGAGFGSFWNIGPESPIYDYAKGWVTELGNGHNGYLDLLAQIGIPGVVLVMVAVFVVPLFRLLASFTAPRGEGGLLVAMLLFCACHNFTETSLFDRDQIVQVFWMLTVALIGKICGPVLAPRRIGRPTYTFHRVASTERGRAG